MNRDAASQSGLAPEEGPGEEDPVHEMLRARWTASEARIAALFGADGKSAVSERVSSKDLDAISTETDAEDNAKTSVPPKKAARKIDDDYGDDDDDEEEDDADTESPLKSKGKAVIPNGTSIPTSTTIRPPAPAVKPSTTVRPSTSAASDAGKSSEDVRKQLEQDKKAAANAAKWSFQSMFYTFESDRDAMLEQQKLDELDREVENEISGGPNAPANAASSNAGTANNAGATQGSLGSADLGASSLTLKHLIARIDMKRDQVQASDNQLRTLISEVRKGRSKWASEDRVGQEELYEASEKVLMELKAMTEYAQPFLQRVSKREAPDYFNVIKTPMDIGTMIKKLKQLAYKSKKEFVDDLNLIWANCLRYNQDPQHVLRKKALYMRKETDKLTPLIPDIVVKDRAEVEAEERRLHNLDAEDSDEEPLIMASRGRKAPKKGASTSARKGPPAAADDTSTPAPEAKPALHASASNLRNDFLRAESEAQDMHSAGFNTPPPGRATPHVNGLHTDGVGSQADVMEIDGLGNSALGTHEDLDEDDTEFKNWKQVTKKDRAQAAAERNRLFRGNNLNPDEPALLRSKAMMRRWQRQQKMLSEKQSGDADTNDEADTTEPSAGGETLAEGIEKDEDSTLPDYFGPLSAIPDLDERWKWTTDSDGHAAPHTAQWLRMYPKGHFIAPQSGLTQKLESNIRQVQDTRKICSKIGVVKQMQIQAQVRSCDCCVDAALLTDCQTYQNQFPKYELSPFVEQDVSDVVVTEDGPLMAPWVNRAAFQRSVGKIFYHAGFEDFQPSALDAITDVATAFMKRVGESLKAYSEQPMVEAKTPRFTFEEQVLHVLDENGMDIEALESYVRDDVERLSTKLGVVHERMKSHLADLLVSCVDSSLIRALLTCSSDLPWAITRVPMAWAHSTMAANNSLAATSRKTWTRTSSDSANSVWLQNSDLRRLACLFICFKIACTAPTRHRMPVLSRAPVSSSNRLRLTSLSRWTTSQIKLVWYRASSATSCAATTTIRWSKTRTCHKSRDSQSQGYHLPARSPVQGNARSGNSSKWQRRRESSRRTVEVERSPSRWASRSVLSDYKCRTLQRHSTRRRMAMAMPR
jgi:transcriptional activator SPT7